MRILKKKQFLLISIIVLFIFSLVGCEKTVTFHVDGKIVSERTVPNKSSLVSQVFFPSKTGYTFRYWSLKPNGERYNLLDPITKNIDLYAIWEISKYNVIFKDGDNILEIKRVKHNSPFYFPKNPKKDGYTFKYWSLKEDGKKYLPTKLITKNIVLYAIWDLNEYRVTIKNGNKVLEELSVKHFDTISEPEEPSKDDYFFQYWKDDSSNLPYNFETPIESDINLKAVWAIDKKSTFYKAQVGGITFITLTIIALFPFIVKKSQKKRKVQKLLDYETERIKKDEEAERIKREEEATRLKEEAERIRQEVEATRVKEEAERIRQEVEATRLKEEAERIRQEVEALRIREETVKRLNEEFCLVGNLNIELVDKHQTFKENQKGISYDILFGPYLSGAKEITITDPYISSPHQLQNFMEFIETVIKFKNEASEIQVHLITYYDLEDNNNIQQIRFLNMIQSISSIVGISLKWEFDESNTLHARDIVTDTGWKMVLDRGLDIFKPYKGKIIHGSSSRTQELKLCRGFYITYVRI